MKSLLILLAVVAATFARPSEEWAEWNSPNPMQYGAPEEWAEWNSPNRIQYGAPWDINESIDTNMEATEQSRRPRPPRAPRHEVFQPGHIYLILGNNNLFLSSIFYIVGGSFTQSIKTQQDEFCRYAVTVLDNGKVAFRDFAGEGLYLQLNPSGFRDFAGEGLYLQLNPSGGVNSIRPTSEVIDDSAQFEVEVSGPGPWKGTHYVYLKAANGNYCGLIDIPVESNIAADYIAV
jgi:hypothetical protein